LQFFAYVPSASLTYTVGAGGAARTTNGSGNDGTNTVLGTWQAIAGKGGSSSGGMLGGGYFRYSVGYDDGAAGWQYTEYALPGTKAGSVCGGFSNSNLGVAGGTAGVGDYLISGSPGANLGGAGVASYGGGAGNSFMGQASAGSNSGIVAATTGYGAGGGGTYTGTSGKGGDGFLLIEEFGSW
jgi:hypothetical protein